jgi:hypothetical protein
MTLEERLEQIMKRLVSQGEELEGFLQKSDDVGTLRRIREMTPTTPSRAQPVVVMDVSKNGILPADVEKSMKEVLQGIPGARRKFWKSLLGVDNG